MKDENFLRMLVLLLTIVQGIALMESVRRVLTATHREGKVVKNLNPSRPHSQQ